MEAQLAYYAVHESAIKSALDAGVTHTMEEQPADPVLHLGKQLVMSAEKAAGIRRLTLEEAEALMAAASTGQEALCGLRATREGPRGAARAAAASRLLRCDGARALRVERLTPDVYHVQLRHSDHTADGMVGGN